MIYVSPKAEGEPETSNYSDHLLISYGAFYNSSEVLKDRIKALIIAKSNEYDINKELVLEIVKRESDFNPNICNIQFGCKSGQGLFQLIPSTVRYCEKKLDKTINPFKAEDNIDCGLWLLSQPNGINHWWDINGLWGSGPY